MVKKTATIEQTKNGLLSKEYIIVITTDSGRAGPKTYRCHSYKDTPLVAGGHNLTIHTTGTLAMSSGFGRAGGRGYVHARQSKPIEIFVDEIVIIDKNN